MKLPDTPNVTRRAFVASVGVATVLPPATALLANSAAAAEADVEAISADSSSAPSAAVKFEPTLS